MASIYPYRNAVEITNNTKDGTWHNVDVSQFVENEDAVGLIVRCGATAGGNPTVGCIGYQQFSDAYYAASIEGGAFFNAVWFVPGSKIIRMYQQANTVIHIVGEFRSGVRFHLWSKWQNAIRIDPEEGSGEANSWVDRTVTLIGDDTYSDIEAVLIGVRCIINLSSWSARKKGAVFSDIFLESASQSCNWLPVGIDENGQYQVYFTAKTVPIFQRQFEAYEIGYIKKGTYTAITEYQDNFIGEFAGWRDLYLSESPTSLPSGGRVAIAWWGIDDDSGTNPYCSLREFGSSNVRKKIVTDASNAGEIIKLNKDEGCQAYLDAPDDSTSMGLYIVGYESYGPDSESSSTMIINSSTIENDSSSILIG